MERATQAPRVVQWTVFLGAVAVIVYLCLVILWPFLSVVAWSAVLAIAFHPVYTYLVRKTGRRSLSAFICSVVVVLVILVPLLFVAGLAINQFLALREYLYQADRAGFDVAAIEPLRRAYEWITLRLGIRTEEVGAWLAANAREMGGTIAGYSLAIAANVTTVVVSFIFTIFATFLLFRDGDRAIARVSGLMPFEPHRNDAILARIREAIHASVYGVIVIALLQGTLCGVMFWILGIPSAALWGTVTVLTSVIPFLGAGVVWVPGVLYLFVAGRWPQAIVLAAWGTLVVSAVDNFLRPRLVGGRVGLSELVMFFALLGGLKAFGFLGIVLGPVLFAVAASVLDVLSNPDAASSDDVVFK